MTTVAMVDGKRRVMTVEEKAKLLTVTEVEGLANVLIVSSGNRPGHGYQVSTWTRRGITVAVECNCDSLIRCSHELAADMYLTRKREEEARPRPVLFSEVCGHRVKHDPSRHCGCMA